MNLKNVSSELLVICLLEFSVVIPVQAQFGPWGSSLTGSNATGKSLQGYSVAISADGNTAIVGGYLDGSGEGAAWVFRNENGIWTQQGGKLVGSGSVGDAWQGVSVAISADGTTVMIGGSQDSSHMGAAWVFAKTNGVWNQQGKKLVGGGAVGVDNQGVAVALSADGNTAIVGGPQDSSNVGAAWVYTRTNGVWSQQGRKLVGTGSIGGSNIYSSNQGSSVALSADGNTAIVGGPIDGGWAGAIWIYHRSDGVWTQQSDKLIGTGRVLISDFGCSIALSADGNTAVVGGYADDSGKGAVWVYIRVNGTWGQQDAKLLGTDAVGGAYLGCSVSLSADGNTAIVGGYGDNAGAGAAWVFNRRGNVWAQQGKKITGTGVDRANFGSSVSISADGNTAIIGEPGDGNGIGAAWIFTRGAIGFAEKGEPIPLRLALVQNYPNPFNPSTTITYELPNSSEVRLSVLDILGREVSVLVNRRENAGSYEVQFEGSRLASGVYFYRLQAGSFVETKKLLLVR